MNKYFNISLTGSYKSDMNNYNYNFDVVFVPIPPVGTSTYFPLRYTSVNPVYNNTGNTGQTINGQSYTFIPNDGLYFDSPPTNFAALLNNSSINDPDVGLWDVSNITDMDTMFYGTPFNQPIGNWNVSNVTDMWRMFQNASDFNQPIGNWNVSKVTDMTLMFRSAVNFNQDLSGWCVYNFSTEPTQFSLGSALTPTNKPVWGTCPGHIAPDPIATTTYFPLRNTGTNPVRSNNGNTGQIFNAQTYTFVPYDGLYFDSPPTNFSNMFNGKIINDPDVGLWDVSNITNMVWMFYQATFNQDLSGWCVSHIPTEPAGFSLSSPLTPGNKPVWGTCP